ncbi:hypothetical protein Hanom_Chr16g01515121 [Helianthus anomalus]
MPNTGRTRPFSHCICIPCRHFNHIQSTLFLSLSNYHITLDNPPLSTPKVNVVPLVV